MRPEHEEILVGSTLLVYSLTILLGVLVGAFLDDQEGALLAGAIILGAGGTIGLLRILRPGRDRWNH